MKNHIQVDPEVIMRLTEAPLFQQRLARLNPVLSLGRKFDDMGGCDNRT